MRAEEVRYETPLTDFLFRKASIDKLPLSGVFELSPICNFNCRMCYVRQSPEQVKSHSRKMMTLAQWKKLADEMENAGLLYLLLTGGEPFLWPDFWELYEYLANKGFVLSINSNGYLIDEEVVAKLSELPLSRINITLYGASDATYRRLCRISDGFSRVTHAISLLREAGIQVKLNCSLTPFNSCDLERVVKYAEERGLILEVNTYMFPPVRKDMKNVGKNERFTPEEAAEWHMRRYYLQYGEERYREFLKKVAKGIAEPMGLDETCYDPVDGKVRCRAGSTSCWITWDGYMTPCGMLPDPKVDLTQYNFKDAWKKMNAYTEKIALSGICKECDNRKICHSCAAMAMAETGDFHKIPVYLCEMMEAMKKIARNQLGIGDTV